MPFFKPSRGGEKGIPFDLESVKKYDPKNIFEAEQPGLGLRLIEEGVDKVEVLVHGRAGKETRLLKRIDRNALPEEFLHSGTEPRLGVRKRTGEIVKGSSPLLAFYDRFG